MFGDEVVLQTMCDTMWHRGPDSEGLWLDTGVALGMRRLAIIDLSTGEQPVWNENKSIVAVMNGELYNFREVRTDLEKRGHKFVSNSDTEIIPHLYEEYGDDFMEQLNGMFTIALWDIPEKKLILTRDRFGEKPLYYGVFGDKLIFASEPKVLLSHGVGKTADQYGSAAAVSLVRLRPGAAFDVRRHLEAPRRAQAYLAERRSQAQPLLETVV